MKKNFASLCVAALLGTSLFVIGCSHETAHTEKTSPTWNGGTKTDETTTYKNADGSTTTEHSASRSNP
jgi:ABC-type oligopeptide transport system substrate-binding subunit